MELSLETAAVSFIAGVGVTVLGTRITYAYNRKFRRRASREENAEKVFDALVRLRSFISPSDEESHEAMMSGGDGGVHKAAQKAWGVELSAMKLGSRFFNKWKSAMLSATSFARRREMYLQSRYNWEILTPEEQKEFEDYTVDNDEVGADDEPTFQYGPEHGDAVDKIEKAIADLKTILRYD